MDARAKLRAFLEQRREMGETEFVLDSLHVDDVLRVLGAPSNQATDNPSPTRAPVEPRRPAEALPAAAKSELPERRASRAAPDAPTDWREALRAAGATQATRGDSVATTVSPAGGPPRTQGTPPIARDDHPAIAEGNMTSASPSPAPNRTAATTTLTIESLGPGLSVGNVSGDVFADAPTWNSLDDIARAVAACTRCSLYAGAKNPVPGAGNPNADFVCVGEAPGANEDEQGVPFVGQAGQLLTKILAAIDLTRDDVFICNVLKHRPPGNRNPQPDEVAACSPYLVRQIALLQPKVILALGTFAAQTLLQTKESIGKLRGRLHRYYGVPVIVTYHPAALLRNPSWKRPTWEDVQLARKFLDRQS